MGFADKRIGHLIGATEEQVRHAGSKPASNPVYKMVRHLRGEFVPTPRISTRPTGGGRALPTPREKVVILGTRAHRIGQGIEFDYACVHAAFALRDAASRRSGHCNPETVSTTTTRPTPYFEPLTFEDVMNIVERSRPRGVIVQFGGQTRSSCGAVERAACRSWAPADAIDRARTAAASRIPRPARLAAGPGLHRRAPSRSLADRDPYRIPGAGAAVLRAGRARHADRVRPRRISRTT